MRSLRVLPNDLDINGHMNNGRYLTVVDLMLMEYFVRSGFARVMLREGWKPMSGGSFISYRRGLKPLQTYTLRFRLDACDGHWNYMRFEFTSDRQGVRRRLHEGRGGLSRRLRAERGVVREDGDGGAGDGDAGAGVALAGGRARCDGRSALESYPSALALTAGPAASPSTGLTRQARSPVSTHPCSSACSAGASPSVV